MPLMSKDFGSSIPPSARAPNSQLINPRRRWPRKSSLNLRMPPFTPSIRLPRKRTGALMICPTTPATRASTFFSIAASSRIVLMIALIAPMALSIRPRFSACNSSIRSSRPLRASTYLLARVSTSASCLASTSLSSSLEPVADLLRRVRSDLLQVLGQALDVRRDLALAGRDPLLRGGQVGADDVGDPGDGLVHLLEVELPAGHVELVDLVGHPFDLVPGPAERPEPAAVPILLVRRHLRRDIALEHRPRGGLALVELLLHLRVDAVEDLPHIGLGGVEDLLDLGRDLGPLRLVLGLGLALVRDQLGQRRTPGALHPGHTGGGLRPSRRPCPGR